MPLPDLRGLVVWTPRRKRKKREKKRERERERRKEKKLGFGREKEQRRQTAAVGDRIQGKKLRSNTSLGAEKRVWVVDSLILARKSENGRSKVPNFLFLFYLDLRNFLSVRSGVFEVCD